MEQQKAKTDNTLRKREKKQLSKADNTKEKARQEEEQKQMEEVKKSALMVLTANPKDFIMCMAGNLTTAELKAHFDEFESAEKSADKLWYLLKSKGAPSLDVLHAGIASASVSQLRVTTQTAMIV